MLKKYRLLFLSLLVALCVLSSCGTSETAEPASPPEAVEEAVAADSEPDDSGADDSEPDDSDEGSTEESGAMVEEDQESDQIGSEGPAIAGDVTPEFAALSDIDQALINSLQSWDWDTHTFVSADIE